MEPPPPPPPPGDDEPPPPPPADDAAAAQAEFMAYYNQQYAVYCEHYGLDANDEKVGAQFAAVYAEQCQQQQGGNAGPSQGPADQASKRPGWLNDIVAKGGDAREEAKPAERPPERSNKGTRAWDERWGYSNPNQRGPPRNSGAPVRAAPPPQRPQVFRGMKMQRCPKWAIWKCKKGSRCPFAHGDHELAPKEVRQRIRREQEAMAKRAAGGGDDSDDEPVRQREAPDEFPEEEGGPDPYEIGDASAARPADDASASAPALTPADAGASACMPTPSEVSAAGGAMRTAGNVCTDFTHREDGTPLGFMTRDSKQEAKRQREIEAIYDDEQAKWGLAGTSSATQQAAAAVDVGRGRDAVRPAWLTRSLNPPAPAPPAPAPPARCAGAAPSWGAVGSCQPPQQQYPPYQQQRPAMPPPMGGARPPMPPRQMTAPLAQPPLPTQLLGGASAQSLQQQQQQLAMQQQMLQQQLSQLQQMQGMPGLPGQGFAPPQQHYPPPQSQPLPPPPRPYGQNLPDRCPW